MNSELAFKIGRQLGRLEHLVWAVPFSPEASRVMANAMITELRRGKGDYPSLIDDLEDFTELVSGDVNKSKVRGAYMSLQIKVCELAND